VELLSRRLQIPDTIIFEAMDRQKEKEVSRPKEKKTEAHHQLSSEETLIGLLVKNPAEIKKIVKKIQVEDFVEEGTRKIYKLLLKWYTESSSQDLENFCIKNLKDEFGRARAD